MTDIYVDADACPVKDEVYRVAQRYGLRVVLVSNAWLRVPNEEWIELVVVGAEVDAADDGVRLFAVSAALSAAIAAFAAACATGVRRGVRARKRGAGAGLRRVSAARRSGARRTESP